MTCTERVVTRLGPLLAVLLLLLAGTSATEHPREPAPGATVSAAPSPHDDLHNLRDQPRHVTPARHTPPTALSDAWWAVPQPTTGTHVPPGRSPVTATGPTEPLTATHTPRSSRAPPQA